MTDEVPRQPMDRGELIMSIVFGTVFLVALAATAGGQYFGDASTTTRWVKCGVGAVLLAVGIALARTCILGLLGVMMVCIGGGFVLGNVAAFVFPRVM